MEDPLGQVFDKTNSDRVTSVNGCIKAWEIYLQGVSCSQQQETLIGETNIRKSFLPRGNYFIRHYYCGGKVCRDEAFTEQPSIQNRRTIIGTPKEVVFPQAVSKFLAYI